MFLFYSFSFFLQLLCNSSTKERCNTWHCHKNTMFVNGPSPIALLHAAVSECRLQYASLITEIADVPTILCGVELELPQLELIGPRHELFFWEATYLDPTNAYEKACLRAVSFLQLFYNLKISNYYSNGHYYSNGIPPHAFHIKSLHFT